MSKTSKFYHAFKMIKDLKYNEKPNYDMISFHFKKVLLDKECVPSVTNYDWSKNEIRERVNNENDVTFASGEEYREIILEPS